MNTDTDIAQQLYDNGYEPTETSSTRQSDGSTSSTWVCVGFHVLCNADGNRRDYVEPRNLPTLELRAAGRRDAFSPVAARFAGALVALLAPTMEPKRGFLRKREEPKPRPFIRRTPRSVQLVYRTEGVSARLNDLSLHWHPALYPHGMTTSDERSVLSLAVSLPNVPIDDGATWADDRSPLTVHRDALPEWNDDSTSAAVAGLVQEWAAAGELNVCGRYVEPAKPADYYTPEAALARDGVRVVVPVDEHTGRSPGDLGRERGRWG